MNASISNPFRRFWNHRFGLFGLGLATTVALGAAGCRSAGSFPNSVILLYEEGDPSGVLEIEADRQGRILGVEAEIPISAVPAELRERAEREVPGGRITGAEREFIGEVEAFEVQIERDGVAYEIVVDRDGRVVEKEVSLRTDEAPSAVVSAARKSTPDARLVSLERVERLGVEEYHAKLDQDGVSYKVVLRADGSVVRKVREARAEIEIPLRK